MSLPFETVREQLLRARVTPRYANRYVTELREHLADLIERERALIALLTGILGIYMHLIPPQNAATVYRVLWVRLVLPPR
jgi:hypothetical protein